MAPAAKKASGAAKPKTSSHASYQVRCLATRCCGNLANISQDMITDGIMNVRFGCARRRRGVANLVVVASRTLRRVAHEAV